jgi:ATP-dependent DNA helicase RecG
MVALNDRLDRVIGAKSAKPLAEHFGIETVDDLLRHYPRKYSDGMTVRGEGEDLELEEGQHVTFVDTITDVVSKPMRRQPGKRQRTYAVVTLGDRRPKVTATFFNADYLVKQLPVGSRVILSGEVSYFRQVMQLTHPAFLVLDGPGQGKGSKSLAKIAEGADDVADMLAAFERDFFPIYPASAKVQSWDIYACVRQVLAVLDPIEDPLPESVLRQRDLCSEDEALRAIHLSDRVEDRERARARLAFDEAVGLQWALVERRHGGLSETGPPAPLRDDGLAAGLMRRLPFELTAGQEDVPSRCTGCCRVRSARARPSSRCSPCCRWSTPGISVRCSHRRKCLPPNMSGPFAMCSDRWRWGANSAVRRWLRASRY